MDYTIRTMVADDADQLVALVRKCFGESYPNKMMYQPEQIAQALADGIMHSVVAIDPAGKLVGHCALTFAVAGAPVPEAGKMIVDPDCRGQHLSNRLAELRMAAAREKNLVGYWSECVTNHPFSQHEIIDMGGVETGLFVGEDAPTWQMAGVNNVTDVRLSLMAFYVPLRSGPERALYLTGPAADFAQILAQELGIERTIVRDAVPEAAASVLAYKAFPEFQFARITVTTIGLDLPEKMATLVADLEARGIEVFILDMPLGQANALGAVSALEALGFFWAAWLPDYTESGDVLRLQKVDAAVNPEEIVCAREHGERIKQHVLAERKRVMKL